MTFAGISPLSRPSSVNSPQEPMSITKPFLGSGYTVNASQKAKRLISLLSPDLRIKSICVSNFNSKKCFKLQTSSNFGAKLSRNEKQHHAILCLTLDSFQAAYLSQDCGASGCPSRSCRMLFPLHVWLITLCSFLLPQCIEDYIEDYPSNYTI